MMRNAADWVRWHTVELAAVTLPTVAAVTVHPAWAALTVGAAARWVLLEVRAHRDTPPPPDGGRRDATAGERDRDGASA